MKYDFLQIINIPADLWSQLTDEEKAKVYTGIGYDETREGSSVDASPIPVQVSSLITLGVEVFLLLCYFLNWIYLGFLVKTNKDCESNCLKLWMSA